MDFDKLIDEITEKVLEKIAGQEPECCSKSEDRPKLLLVSQQYNNNCCRMLKSGKLSELYQMDNACRDKWEACPADYEAIVLSDLTCNAMVKIAAGLADSEYTRLVSAAILSGKRIYVSREEIQLFQFKGTAPGAYYSMLLKKLNILSEYGIIFCDSNNLEDEILKTSANLGSETEGTSGWLSGAAGGKNQVVLNKKVVTERDIRAVSADEADCILVNTGTIITDLAFDYAKSRGLCIRNL